MKHKTDAWRIQAHDIVKKIAENNQYIVSDMVVTALEAAGLGLDNYSALGGVFKRAAGVGYIQKTSEKEQSTRTKSHSAKTVWVSLIHVPKDVSPEARALNKMIIAALEFNAVTVRFASIIYRKEGLDQKTHKRAVNEFQKITDQYIANKTKI